MTAALILAGGRSRRFGGDKTRAVLAGNTLLERVIAATDGLVDETLVLGGWAPPGTAHRLEPERFEGPLAALAHGLGIVGSATCLVLAADHPHLQPRLLQLVLARHGANRDDRHVDATVPVTSGGPQPLVACYDTAAVATIATALVASGERRLVALLDHVDVEWITEAEWRDVDPDGRSFDDVDAPDDLARAVERSDPQR